MSRERDILKKPNDRLPDSIARMALLLLLPLAAFLLLIQDTGARAPLAAQDEFPCLKLSKVNVYPLNTPDGDERLARVEKVLEGPAHSMTFDWTGYSNDALSVQVMWDPPPPIICSGDVSSHEIAVNNYAPNDRGGNVVGVKAGPPSADVGGGAVKITCDEPPSMAYIPKSVANWSNKCRIDWADMRPADAVEEKLVFGTTIWFPGLDGLTMIVDYLYNKSAAPSAEPEEGSPAERDGDNDGLSDEEEAHLGTNPNNRDSDGDGLSDGEEVQRGTNPRNPDSDEDGRTDGQEVAEGTNPLDPNDPGDGAEGGEGPVPPSRTRTADLTCADVGPGTWLIIGSRSKPQGSTVRIPVRLCGADQLGDLNATINYDAGVLRATGFQRGAMLGNALFDANLEPQGTIRLGMADSEGISGDGFLAYFDFDVIGEPGSQTPLSGQVATANRADNDQAVQVSVIDGLFIVLTIAIPGDHNGDGRLTSLDALAALRMSIGKLPVDLLLDVDNDGQVTAEDARWILQAVIGLRTL